MFVLHSLTITAYCTSYVQVQISPPPPGPNGIQATGESVLDSEGKLIGVKLTQPGAGYNSAEAPVTVELIGAAIDIGELSY
jgi:hypothetical protein